MSFLRRQESIKIKNTIFMPLEKFNTFYIESATFNYESLICSLHYSFDKKEYFTEQTHFQALWFTKRDVIQKEIVETICFHMLIAFWISYYKLCPTTKIVVEAWHLDWVQKDFWRKFYINWLGEFFYKNNINFNSLCFFESSNTLAFEKQEMILPEKYLVPIGWGKDSIVTTILLDEQWVDNITPFVFWKSDTIKKDFLNMYWKKELLITRKLSENLFKMNEQWYLNGHVPITWLISFALILVCYLYEYKYIVFSNEKSANIGNTEFFWSIINHRKVKNLKRIFKRIFRPI